VSSEPDGRQNNLVTLFLRAAHGMTDELVARLAAARFAGPMSVHQEYKPADRIAAAAYRERAKERTA